MTWVTRALAVIFAVSIVGWGFDIAVNSEPLALSAAPDPTPSNHAPPSPTQPDSAPALLSPSQTPTVAGASTERFRVEFPHAFVDNATGAPTVFRGINLRDTVSATGWHAPRERMVLVRDAGFDMVRLGLQWRDFETGPGTWNDAAFDALEAHLDDLDSLGLQVILDPIHVKGPGERDGHWFEVPSWVWQSTPRTADQDTAEREMIDKVAAHAGPFLAELTRRVGDRPEVVAIDLVNEVRGWPPVDADAADGIDHAQDRALDMYDGLIDAVRAIDPDQIVIIEPVYGNSDPRPADLGRIAAPNRVNLLWSFHDYYAGGAGAGFSANGNVVGTNVWSGRTDYPGTAATREAMRTEQAHMIDAHVSWAARWNVPTIVGEFGIGADMPRASEFVRDKVELYQRSWAGADGLTSAYWVWSNDGNFGLHQNGTTSALTTQLTERENTTLDCATGDGPGYLLGEESGVLHGFGVGFTTPLPTTGPGLVDVVLGAGGCGAWALHRDGTLTAAGGVNLPSGTIPAVGSDERYVAMEATATEQGLWLFTDRGRVVALGDATLAEGPGGITDLLHLNLQGAIIDAAAAPDGRGYVMLGTDGGVFAFGDDLYRGSLPELRLQLAAPAVGIVLSGSGYWIAASDGGVFAFDSPYRGSVPEALGPGARLNEPVVAMIEYGNGYVQVASDGGTFVFADRPFLGSLGAEPPATPVVAVG